jgi:AraC-like DNA-binding protein
MQFLFNDAEWFPVAMQVQKTAVAVIMLVATSLTAYYGLRNPMLFDTITEKPNVEQAIAISILTPEVKKVIKKNIKEEDVEPYLNQINTIVEQEKLFLNAGLTPSLLAQRVGIPVYKLTLALNKGAGKNFNEYINFYRVNHAKSILINPENNKTTIYAVALDSGFSSEAPFYAAFKKYVGKSPSAYRNSLEDNKQ